MPDEAVAPVGPIRGRVGPSHLRRTAFAGGRPGLDRTPRHRPPCAAGGSGADPAGCGPAIAERAIRLDLGDLGRPSRSAPAHTCPAVAAWPSISVFGSARARLEPAGRALLVALPDAWCTGPRLSCGRPLRAAHQGTKRLAPACATHPAAWQTIRAVVARWFGNRVNPRPWTARGARPFACAVEGSDPTSSRGASSGGGCPRRWRPTSCSMRSSRRSLIGAAPASRTWCITAIAAPSICRCGTRTDWRKPASSRGSAVGAIRMITPSPNRSSGSSRRR